jgi:hypothetical protein
MHKTCKKCGARDDGTFAGYNPCHLRTPVVEDHNFHEGLFLTPYYFIFIFLSYNQLIRNQFIFNNHCLYV